MKPVVFVLHPSVRARAYLQRALAVGLGPDAVVRIGPDAADVARPPWQAPADVLEKAGVTLGDTYPQPIVDLKASRKDALDAFQSLKDGD